MTRDKRGQSTDLVAGGRRKEWRGRLVNVPVERASTILFDSVDIPSSAITILVNSFEKRMLQSINVGDVERALGRPVRATFNREKGSLAEAQDQGLLLSQVARKARFSQDIAAFAEELCAEGSVPR